MPKRAGVTATEILEGGIVEQGMYGCNILFGTTRLECGGKSCLRRDSMFSTDRMSLYPAITYGSIQGISRP